MNLQVHQHANQLINQPTNLQTHQLTISPTHSLKLLSFIFTIPFWFSLCSSENIG